MADTIAIDDASDPRLSDYRLLNDQAARRRMEGDEFFIAEGYVALDRLLDSGHEVRSVLLGQSRVERLQHQLPQLAQRGIPVYVVEREVLCDVAGFNLNRGVVASAQRRPLATVEEIATSARRVAVLEGLNDAENIGAISRAARALGIDAMLIDSTCTDTYSRRTVRVSMGEVLYLPIARAATQDWPQALDVLHRHGFETWAMTPAADAQDLWTLAVPPRIAVIFGAEGPGLDRRTMATATRRVQIPIRPDVDSLNVGHASAITFAAIGRRSPA